MCRLPGFATWPCDELNPLWRTGNTGYPSDAIPISQLSPRIEHRIRSAFDRQARSHQCDVLVEKTCANCLRPQFVRKCFPNAKFLQIVRNVVDTTSSTVGRWNAPSDYRYLLQKARFVPLRDLPRTVARAAIRRICRGGAPQARPWGPVLSADVLPAGALLSESAYAALQWMECVRRTDEMLAELPATQSCTIKYEQFVVDPAPALIAAMAQLNFNVDSADVDVATGPRTSAKCRTRPGHDGCSDPIYSRNSRSQHICIAMDTSSMSKIDIPSWPQFEADEIEAVTRVLQSGRVNAWTGPDVGAFEEAWKQTSNCGHAMAMANGTLTIESAIRRCSLTKKRKLLCPPHLCRKRFFNCYGGGNASFCRCRLSDRMRHCGDA